MMNVLGGEGTTIVTFLNLKSAQIVSRVHCLTQGLGHQSSRQGINTIFQPV